MTETVESRSAADTFAYGKALGEKAAPGEIYTLVGDLGVGKTVFTQGFAAGLGITEPVSSPTFTILQIYEGGRLPFYHFDVGIRISALIHKIYFLDLEIFKFCCHFAASFPVFGYKKNTSCMKGVLIILVMLFYPM